MFEGISDHRANSAELQYLQSFGDRCQIRISAIQEKISSCANVKNQIPRSFMEKMKCILDMQQVMACCKLQIYIEICDSCQAVKLPTLGHSILKMFLQMNSLVKLAFQFSYSLAQIPPCARTSSFQQAPKSNQKQQVRDREISKFKFHQTMSKMNEDCAQLLSSKDNFQENDAIVKQKNIQIEKFLEGKKKVDAINPSGMNNFLEETLQALSRKLKYFDNFIILRENYEENMRHQNSILNGNKLDFEFKLKNKQSKEKIALLGKKFMEKIVQWNLQHSKNKQVQTQFTPQQLQKIQNHTLMKSKYVIIKEELQVQKSKNANLTKQLQQCQKKIKQITKYSYTKQSFIYKNDNNFQSTFQRNANTKKTNVRAKLSCEQKTENQSLFFQEDNQEYSRDNAGQDFNSANKRSGGSRVKKRNVSNHNHTTFNFGKKNKNYVISNQFSIHCCPSLEDNFSQRKSERRLCEIISKTINVKLKNQENLFQKKSIIFNKNQRHENKVNVINFGRHQHFRKSNKKPINLLKCLTMNNLQEQCQHYPSIQKITQKKSFTRLTNQVKTLGDATCFEVSQNISQFFRSRIDVDKENHGRTTHKEIIKQFQFRQNKRKTYCPKIIERKSSSYERNVQLKKISQFRPTKKQLLKFFLNEETAKNYQYLVITSRKLNCKKLVGGEPSHKIKNIKNINTLFSSVKSYSKNINANESTQFQKQILNEIFTQLQRIRKKNRNIFQKIQLFFKFPYSSVYRQNEKEWKANIDHEKDLSYLQFTTYFKRIWNLHSNCKDKMIENIFEFQTVLCEHQIQILSTFGINVEQDSFDSNQYEIEEDEQHQQHQQCE